MDTIYYDNQWDANEWFVIGTLIFGFTLIAVLPRRIPLEWSAVFVLYGIFAGLCLDHSISVVPIDYYDVNDSSNYEVMDFLSYVMYGPFTYLFAYLYDRWKIKPAYDPIYILGWALLSYGVEWIAAKAGVFHYKNGYSVRYSFPIYLVTASVCLLLLYKVNSIRHKSTG